MTDSETSGGIEMTTSRLEREAKAKADAEDAAKETDPVQRAMGALGPWHVFTCFVIFMLKFPVAWHQMGIIFLAPPTKFECANATMDRCDKDCPEYEYDTSVFSKTIITEWDLVCDKAQLSNVSQTIFMLGILVGSLFFGTLADKYGRRTPLVWAVIIQLVSGVATAFAPWFWLFCVLRFITALVTGGTMVTSFVLTMEIVGTKWREVISVIYQIPFNLGHLTLAGFAYFIRDWQYLQFALSIPSIFLVSYYWLIPESPRWLFTIGRIDEAAVVLEKAAKRNHLPTENIKTNLEIHYKANSADKPIAKGNVLDLVRTPNMRAKTLFMLFNWFVCGLAFFGVAQYIGQAGGNIFSNVAISAALELPGTIICIFMMKYLGRKKTLIASNTLTGIAMLTIAFVPQDASVAIVTLASAGLIGMSISFPTVYLYAGELFPTVIRNVGIGMASLVARIAAMIAPFVAGLSATHHWLPAVIFGVIPLIGAAMVFFLPETQGHPLPETVEDGEAFGKRAHKNASIENGK